MAIKSVRKQLLIQSAIALSVAASPIIASAVVTDVAGPTTTVNSANAATSYRLTGTHTTFDVTSPGTITGDATAGVAALNLNGFAIGTLTVAAASNAVGIVSGNTTGAAIDASTTGSRLTQLTLTTGRISSAATGADTNNTIVLGGSAAAQAINVAASQIIRNTGNGGVAIGTKSTNTTNTLLTITNAGTIDSTGDSASKVLNIIDTDGGSALTVTNTGAITATSNTANAINVGTSGTATANTATITNNVGGVITGTITATGNAGLTVTNNATAAASIDGDITGGTGIVHVTNAGSGTIAGNITLGSNAASTLAVSGGAITGNVVMNNAAQTTTLTSGGTSVSGTINGAGKLIIGANTTQGGVIGGSTALTSITVNDGFTFTGGANAITAGAVILGSSTAGTAALTLGTGTVTGTIDGNAANRGILNFGGNNTTGGNIGTTTGSLAQVNVANGATVTLNHNLAATTVTGTGTGSISLAAGKNITATDIKLATGGTLTVNTSGGTPSVVTGNISGVATGQGTLALTGGAGTFTQSSVIGATAAAPTVARALAAITVASGNTLALNNNVFVTQVTDTGTITQSAGVLTGAVDVATGGIYNLNGGSVTGVIQGATDGAGTLNVNQNYTNTAVLGSGANSLLNLTIGAGKTLTLGANIDSTNITVGNGKLDLGDVARTVVGATTVGATGTVALGSVAHTGTGTLTTVSGSTVDSDLSTGGNNGRVNLSSTATLVSGTKLNLNIASGNTSKVNAGAYTIVNGTGGTGVRILDSNIYLNGVNTTNNGVLSVTSSSNGAGTEDLVVTVSRAAYNAAGGQSSNERDIATAILNSGAASLGAIQTTLGNYNSSAELNAALSSLTPQADNAISQGTYSAATQSMDVVQTRLENARDSGKASGDTVGSKGVWAQAFGSTATQDQRSGTNGYDADTYGIILGADKQLGDNTRLGLSANYARTNVDSDDNLKTTDIDTYQANVYATRDLGRNFYVDGLAGFAWNRFDSERKIPAAGVTADGDFNGQTYLARVGGGYRYYVPSTNLDITPTLNVTYAHNEFDNYSEKGAGALNLKVNNDSTDILEPRVGIKAGYTLKSDGLKIRPEVRASYGYDLIGDNQVTESTFNGTNTSFRTEGADAQQGGFSAGAGIDLISRNSVTLSADYDYQVKSDYDQHSGLVRLRYDF